MGQLTCVRHSFGVDTRTDLLCEGRGAERWRTMLPVLLDAARGGGRPPWLIPRDPDVGPKQPERRLWRRLV